MTHSIPTTTNATDTLPDLLIVFGPRGLLSLAGIVLIIGGVWYADRQWDEMGSAAYKRAEKERSNKRNKSSSSDEETTLLKQQQDAVVIPQEDLKKAFPLPIAFLLGWILYGLSYFGPVEFGSSSGWVFASWYAIASAIVSLALGWIASVPMGDAVQQRNASKKKVLGMLFVTCWLLLTIFSGGTSSNSLTMTHAHAMFRVVGAVCIIASMKILWKFRKMGDTWETEGKPNPNPVVYNIGGPLFVLGWFFFWIGMAATADTAKYVTAFGVPIYFSLRSAIAFLSGCGMVPIVMMVDYAHDEGALPNLGGFGTDGRFFGRFWEGPLPFVGAWTLFGLASWIPLLDGNKPTTMQCIILVNCMAQGIVAGLLIQRALYKGDMAGKTRWSIPFVLLFLALAVELGLAGPGGFRWFSIPGAILIILGQKTVFGDRKRGDYWMETQQVNPNPIVYSYGEPLFMTGWILMSLVIAMPMGNE